VQTNPFAAEAAEYAHLRPTELQAYINTLDGKETSISCLFQITTSMSLEPSDSFSTLPIRAKPSPSLSASRRVTG